MVTTAKTIRKDSNLVSLVLCLVSCVLCLAQLTNTATAATTYYVDDTNGNDTYDGNEAKPWKTIARAYSTDSRTPKVQAGDTVYLKNGTYLAFSLTNYSNTNWITYKAVTGHLPVLPAISISNGILGNVYLIFDGIKISNDSPSISNGGIKLNKVRHVKLQNTEIAGAGTIDITNVGTQDYPAIFMTGNNEDIDINSCAIHSSSASKRFGWSTGIYSTGETDLDITNCSVTGVGIGIVIQTTGGTIRDCNIHGMIFDGIILYGCMDLIIEKNLVHDMKVYRPTLNETTTATTWDANGKVMTNAGALWNTAGENKITNQMEIVPISGTNCYTENGEHTGTDFQIQSVSEDGTQITLSRGIAKGGQPSNVDYYIMSSSHADLIQANAYMYQTNITIRKNLFYDIGNTPSAEQFGHLNPTYVTSPFTPGGINFLIENNLFWSAYASATDETNGKLNLASMDSCVFRNNIVIGYLHTYNSTANGIIMSGNIISFVDFESSAALVMNYNIMNRGIIQTPTVIGTHDIRFHNSVNAESWQDANFLALFTNFAGGVFTHASATSLGVGHGDPANYPLSDILGHSRDSSPDAGCYEYISSNISPQSSSNKPPNADAGSDRTVTDSDQSGSEQVTLDGSGSSGNIADSNYVWTWTTKDGNKSATGVKPTVSLPLGRYTITLKVTDNSGLTDTDTVVITVEAEEGLVGLWKFNDGSGLYANDSSGYSITGRLLNGPLWTTQGEISFDGNNDAVEINTATLNISSGTVALWVNPRGFSKTKHYLFGHLTQPANNRIQLFCNASGTLGVGLGNNASTNTNIQTLNTQEWYHIALTWSGTSYAVFVDGQQKASGTFSGISAKQTYADIGNSGNRSQLSEAFYGLIDEVRLYNRALSADEVANHALVFLPIGNKTIGEGETLTFPVKTKFGTIVEISDTNLPHNPSFTSNVFTWTPDYDDAGTYEVEFTAPHDSNEDFERITVTVTDTQQEGPVGNWKFDELSGEIASDSSTTGNTGYLRNGLVWGQGQGKRNGVIMFSVPNDAVEIQTTKLNPRYGTIAMWVYMDNQTLSRHYLFGHASSTLTNRIQLYLKYGNLCLGLGNSHETRTDIQQLQTQQWYHIALAWSEGTYNVYVDGVLKATGTYSGLTGLADHADIGNNGVTRDKGLNGSIDDVVIYNRALNADEIAVLATN